MFAQVRAFMVLIMRNEYAKVSDPNSFVTCPGSPIHTIYSAKVREDGKIILKESGKENIQQSIDSFRESTDMQYIIHRLALGDTSVLNQNTPHFGDFTQMPKTYAESLQLVIDSKKKFYELPVDVRAKFDNDFNQWFATAGNDVWLSKMGIDKPKEEIEPIIPDPAEKEVTE